MARGTVRREVRIACPPDDAWAYIGDATRLPEWFPGIVEATVEGDSRVIVTGSGISMPEQIVTNDALAHRFQYCITAPMVVEHLSTLDVYDLGDSSCLVAYSCDADPATMALLIAGAAGNALENLRDLLEGRA